MWFRPPKSPTIVGSAVATIVWSSAASSITSTRPPKITRTLLWLDSVGDGFSWDAKADDRSRGRPGGLVHGRRGRHVLPGRLGGGAGGVCGEERRRDDRPEG